MGSESSGTALAVAAQDRPMTIEQLKEQVALVHQIYKGVMQKDQHYGIVPGCGDKPTLLKPGAEKLASVFGLDCQPEVEVVEMERGHREYRVKVTIFSQKTAKRLGGGVGSATTMESKYRFRKAEQTCPECGKPAIIKGKKEYGGGWLCFQKKGGCGAKFADGDASIENQNMGRVEHDNPADYYNTCTKMAKKRAQVDAILSVTGASDIFTQDIEEMAEDRAAHDEPPIKTVKARVEDPKPAPQAERVQKARAVMEKAKEVFDGQEEPPMADDGQLTVEGPIEAASEKATSRGGKMYGFKVAGDWYNTFDSDIAEELKVLKAAGKSAAFVYSKREYSPGKVSRDIISVIPF